MADTFEWIKDATEEFSPLYNRMDKDRDLYNMIEYQLKDIETGKPAKDVANITMNDPKVFADKAQAFMNEASMQTIVTGRHLQDSETTIIESFDKDIRYNIDQQLMVRDITSLYSFLVEQTCIRGTAAARYVSWDDDGNFVPDLLPCDSRYLVYEYGRKDLLKVGFRTTRTKGAILEEYPNAVLPGNAKKAAVWEVWDKEKCEIWVSDPSLVTGTQGQQVKEKDNIFDYVPFIIQGVGAGSMLQDEGAIEHRHESIFASNRLLYDQLSMLATILNTLNYMSFNRVHMWESEAGTTAKKPPKPTGRKTIPIDKGTRGLFPVELTDIKNATRLFYALILGAIQRGSLSNIDYGNLTFPLSAVAIKGLQSSKETIFWPRVDSIAWFYRKLHYMIKDQYIKGGYSAELGEEGLEKTYNAVDLDKKYKIEYKFHTVSPEDDIANYAVAQQALAVGISRHTVYTKNLKFEDPDGEIMEGRAERAEQLDPIVALFRYAHALIEKGDDQSLMESRLIKDQIMRLLRQRYAAPLEQQEESPLKTREKAPQSLVPLMEGGGGRGAPASKEEGDTIVPEEMLRREERRDEAVRKSEVE